MIASLGRLVYPLLGMVALIAVWHVSAVQFHVSQVVLPRPGLVLDSLIENRALLLSEGWVTLQECIYGFGLALLVGIPIAVAVSTSRLLSLTFYPLLIASQSIPKVAIAPIILVWLGTEMKSKLAIAFLVAFFPVVVDTAAGLRATPRELLDLAYSLRASWLQTFVKVQFPAALPFIFAGAKVAVTLAVIGAVIGEFVGSNEGLGNLLLMANAQVDSPLAFAALIALSVLGLLLFAVVILAERILVPWAEEGSHAG
jgi:NitT/TauT family transport system permease protein